MNLHAPSSELPPNKWQQMERIVDQNRAILPPNLTENFKKLFLKRFLITNVFVFLIQYSGLNLSTLSGHLSPLWLATGTSCAYLFLRGPSVLPGIWLGTFCAYYLAKAGWLLSLSCASLLSIQALLLLWFNYRYLSPTLIFYELRSFITFILFTTVLTAFISIPLLMICSISVHDTKPLWQLGVQWWLANLNAILIFSCAFITFDAYFPRSYSIKQRNMPLYLLYGGLIFVILGLCASQHLASIVFFAVCTFALTLIISILFGWCYAMIALFLAGILLSFAAFMGAAVFSTPFSSLTLIYLQLLLTSEVIIGLGLAIQSRKGY